MGRLSNLRVVDPVLTNLAIGYGNADLVAELAATGVDTSDEWITARTGIRQRHVAGPDETTATLAKPAHHAIKLPRTSPSTGKLSD